MKTDNQAASLHCRVSAHELAAVLIYLHENNDTLPDEITFYPDTWHEDPKKFWGWTLKYFCHDGESWIRDTNITPGIRELAGVMVSREDCGVSLNPAELAEVCLVADIMQKDKALELASILSKRWQFVKSIADMFVEEADGEFIIVPAQNYLSLLWTHCAN
jgi:hypothetical protein